MIIGLRFHDTMEIGEGKPGQDLRDVPSRKIEQVRISFCTYDRDDDTKASII